MRVHGQFARVLLVGVRAYRSVRAGRLSPCRFEPTCSAYALTALTDHGAVRGAWLVARRLGRCHPLGGHGWDPVPPPPPHARAGDLPLIPQGKT